MSSIKFFTLPSSVCVEILSIWCDEITLTRFDTSVCGKKERESVFNWYKYPLFLYNSNHFKLSHEYFEWVDVRKIKLGTLNVGRRISDVNLVSKPENNFSVKTLVCMYNIKTPTADLDMVRIINSCISLKELKLINESSPLNHNVILLNTDLNPVILNQLNGLELNYYHLNSETIEYLSVFCTNLTDIRFHSNSMSEASLMSLLKVNPNLKTLVIDSVNQSLLTNDILDCIAQHNTAIKQVVLFKFAVTVSLVSVTNVIKSCGHLIYLSLAGNRNNQYFSYGNIEYCSDYSDNFNANNVRKFVNIVGLKSKSEDGYDISELEHFFKVIPNFNEIKIMSCNAINDQLLFTMTNNHKSIRSLTLVDCGDLFGAEWLGKLIAGSDVTINKVVIHNASHLNNKQLLQVFTASSFTKLKTIAVNNHSTLDADTVTSLLLNVPSLERLELEKNKSLFLSKETQVFIATNYPQVTLSVR